MSHVSDKILHNTDSTKQQVELSLNSILRNLHNILNTRSSLGLKEFLKTDAILDNTTFGIPDLTFVCFTAERDKKMMCEAIKKGITQFENRLTQVKVSFSSYNPQKKTVEIKVSAHFSRDNVGMSLLLNLNTREFTINEWEHK